MDTNYRFEELMARYLCGELDLIEMRTLFQLCNSSPELITRFQYYRNVDLLLARNLESDVAEDLEKSEMPTVNRFRSRPIGGGISRSLQLAAAALFFLTLGVGIFLFSNQSGGEELTGRLTLAIGDCRSGGKLLQSGAPLSETAVQSGTASVCDIQIHDYGNAVVRLEPDTEIELIALSGGRAVRLRSGVIIIDAEKLKRDERLLVYAGDAGIEFLGTRLTVEMTSQKKVNVAVLEGRVSVRISPLYAWPRFWNRLSPERQALYLKRLAEVQDIEGAVITAGTALGIDHGQSEQVRRARTRFEKAQESYLNRDAIIPMKSIMWPVTLNKIRELTRTELKAYRARIQHMERLSDREMGNADEVRRIAQKRDRLSVLRGVLAPKLPGYQLKLIFKDGREVIGIAYEENGYYIVLNKEGRRLYKSNLIKRVELILNR